LNAEKTHFQPAKTQKMTISQDYRISNLEVICEEQMTAYIKYHTKHDIETSKISPFYLLFREKSMQKKQIFYLQKRRK
jgi:hypothetical protein